MSLPLLLYALRDLENEENTSFYGGDLGLGLQPRHIHRSQPQASIRVPLALALAAGRLGADRRADGKGESAVSNIGKDGFQVCMDVQHFKPSELSVRVVDNSIVIEGKHEEREDDHGYISRHFVRRYPLPKDYEADKVVSALSSDGVLSVSIPKPKTEDKCNERVVHIQQTGPAHLNVKENGEDKADKECATNGEE